MLDANLFDVEPITEIPVDSNASSGSFIQALDRTVHVTMYSHRLESVPQQVKVDRIKRFLEINKAAESGFSWSSVEVRCARLVSVSFKAFNDV